MAIRPSRLIPADAAVGGPPLVGTGFIKSGAAGLNITAGNIAPASAALSAVLDLSGYSSFDLITNQGIGAANSFKLLLVVISPADGTTGLVEIDTAQTTGAASVRVSMRFGRTLAISDRPFYLVQLKLVNVGAGAVSVGSDGLWCSTL